MSPARMIATFGLWSFGLAAPLILLATVAGKVLASDEIAFISERTGDAEIFTVDVRTNIVLNISRHPAWDRDFIWSPNGQSIAFYSNRYGDRQWDVYTINADGTGLRQVTNDRQFEWNITWFADSNEIGYVVPEVGGGSAMVVVDTDGGTYSQQTITDMLNPTWSPDGKFIAFFAYSRRIFGLFLVDADGSNRRLVADNFRAQIGDISWSPNQQHIAFVSKGRIYVVTLADGETHLLDTHDAWEPSWSPDGRRITFMSFRDGNSELYVVDADGSNLRRLTFHPARDSSPVYRP
jgi:TolB protein